MTDNPSLPDRLNRLSRDMLANGTVYKLATARDGAASTVLSMEELQASRRQFLADQHGGEDIWIFGYGSLSGTRLSILKNVAMASFSAFINDFVYGRVSGAAIPIRRVWCWHWTAADR